MKSKTSGPTLTDAKGMGGINAQDGFDYQLWDAVARLPHWLKDPAFEGLIVEGLEDVEARFFTPNAPLQRVVDRYQLKSGTLSAAAVKDVVKSFYDFDTAHPNHARVQTLVTPQLPADLKWIERDASRIERARPFYRPFANVLSASEAKFRQDLVDLWGDQLGPFYQQNVQIKINPVTTAEIARAHFADAVSAAFTDTSFPTRQMNALFVELIGLLSHARGTLLARRHLLAFIAERLGQPLLADTQLPLHILSDRVASLTNAIEIDASLFSGSGETFPEIEKWRDELKRPVVATATWAYEQGFRRVSLSGMFRLSTAFLLGWAFRSATGFELDVPTRAAIWNTDGHHPTSQIQNAWKTISPTKTSFDRLGVVIGVMREPFVESKQAFASFPPEQMLVISHPEPIKGAVEAQAFAQAVKSQVATCVGKAGATSVDLFMAVPSAFAVVLGHRWNAMPPTQTYEYIPSDRRYMPAVCV